jgi:hypothetical protein
MVTANEGQTLDPLEFSSDQVVTYRHDGVGSGESSDLVILNRMYTVTRETHRK